MTENRRKCIFTNQEADSKLVISGDNQNWAKSVPASRDYVNSRGDKSLSALEFELVELFFKKELIQSESQQVQLRMQEIQLKIKENPFPIYYDEPKNIKDPAKFYTEVLKANVEEKSTIVTLSTPSYDDIAKEPIDCSFFIEQSKERDKTLFPGNTEPTDNRTYGKEYVENTEFEEDEQLTEEEEPVKVDEDSGMWD